MKKYRLGIDMGSTSLGWCALELDDNYEPVGILRMGVRIFDDGRDAKSKEPLGVTRRLKRSMRRNQDRYIQRRTDLINSLIQHNLLPSDEISRKALVPLNPYELRARGIKEEISLHELGRAIFHLSKRRGFLSNRKVDNDEKETGKTKDAIKNLKGELKELKAHTIGEYLYKLNASVGPHQQHKKFSLRFHADGTDKAIFPDRKLIVDEFKQIWDKQASYHPELSDAIKAELLDVIFYQRPLKAQPKGKCIFELTEPRAMKANPYFQEFRILSEVNNLVLVDMEFKKAELNKEQRELVLDILSKQKTSKFKALRKKLLSKAVFDEYQFNLEDEKRKELLGNATLIMLSDEKAFGKGWDKLSSDVQSEVVTLILNDENDPEIENNLLSKLTSEYSLTPEQADYVIHLHLPAGTGNLSEKAIKKIIPFLRQGFIYSDACEQAGYKHSNPGTGEVFVDGDLPYYGKIMPTHVAFGDPNGTTDEEKYGKIANPTVHIALNQLRKLVNQLTIEIGPASQIVIELARELKLSRKQLDENNKRQFKERKHNEFIAEELESLNMPNTYSNRLRYKLWEDLNKDPLKRCCPYSGKPIERSELFSAKFEIEHILPKSKTYDDSFNNKTISLREANRNKGERSPFEAFGHSPKGYDWELIKARSQEIQSYGKRMKFTHDAMEVFADEGKLLDRMLNDTRYMTRIAREYMTYIAGPNQVWSIPGMMTSRFRHFWGLNELLSDTGKKDRSDHRHHAIDALVVGLTSRSMMQRYYKAIKKSGDDRFLEKMPEPFENFVSDAQVQLDAIIISHRPDHGNAQEAIKVGKGIGAIHEETAYSVFEGEFNGKENKKGYVWTTIRKPISSFTSEKDFAKIKDNNIRLSIAQFLNEHLDSKFSEAMTKFSEEIGVKRVKLIEEKKLATLFGVKDKTGKVYKHFAGGGNYCADIYAFPEKFRDKKLEGKWKCEIIPNFAVHQHAFIPNWKQEYPMAKRIMRLQINDMVALDTENGVEYFRVKKMSNGIVFLRGHLIAKKDKQLDDIGEKYSANQLQQLNARKISVTITGKVKDRYK